MALPRLLSEYFAARAQSDGSIAANTDADVANRSNSPVSHCWRIVFWGAQAASL
jgi:hypothetical protein